MLEQFPGKSEKGCAIYMFPMENGARWISTRECTIVVPVDKLTFSEIHMAPGTYKFSKNGKKRSKIDEHTPSLNAIFPDSIGGEMTIDKHDTATTEDKREIDIVLMVPKDESGQFKREGDGNMLRKDLLEMIMTMHPKSVPYSTGERMYPVYFIDDNSKLKTEKNIVAAIMGIKYWE